MQDDNGRDILDGVKEYLREHFPGCDITEEDEPRTRSVILHNRGPHSFHIEVTERLLDGDEGTTAALDVMRKLNLAQHVRKADGRLVTLRTDGISTT